mgnify:CR=1 FL=1
MGLATCLAQSLQLIAKQAILQKEDPMFQIQNQELRPQVTAHLAQTMSLLEMTSQEIQQKIETELANNPALEIVEERRCPNCGRVLTTPGPCPVCSQPYELTTEDPIVFVSSQEDFPSISGKERNRVASGNGFSRDNYIPQVDDLPTYVLRQIAPELQEDQRLIAAHILNNLDEDGLLTTPLSEISQFYHVPTSKVSSVSEIIQHADPLGVGASSPKEALLIQLEMLQRTSDVPDLTREAIEKGMKDLSKHSYRKLAKLLDTSHEHAEQIANFIRSNLNPYPARAYWGDYRQQSEAPPQAYHRPDIIIKIQENSPRKRLIVEIISPYRGTLRVNPLFRKAQKEAPQDKKQAWGKDLEGASLLIKCLQQRNHTMEQLMTVLVKGQRPFILSGDPAKLHPQTQAEMAELLDVHESTISRAVSDKSVQLPNNKIIPLQRFFDRSLPVRTILCRLVEEETTPLTDAELAEELKGNGYEIARRTVAKYRSMEGILSSRLR